MNLVAENAYEHRGENADEHGGSDAIGPAESR